MISGEYNVDSRLKAAKARAESSEASIRQQIKDENYEGKKRSLPIDENALLKKADPTLWKETMDAIIKRDDAKHELELLKRKDELEKRSFYKKALDTARLVIGTMKAINAGIDDSVTFVQLGLAVMANPGKAVSAK